MKLVYCIAAAMFAASASFAQTQPYQTGLGALSVADTQSARPLDGFVWYPTDAVAPMERVHGNAVWTGIEAIADAPAAPGQFPLVVLSHGMYGNAMNQSWLAAELARNGYVVTAISHPGTSTWSRDPDDARKLWERPRDVSRVIDHVLADSDLRARIDPDRIFAAGHSLGGFTTVALAGGRYDATGFGQFCDQHPGELACGIWAGWNVAQTPEDRKLMQADLSDPRIRGFAVFDLGGTQTFSKSSLGGITAPMLILGAPRDINGTGLDLDIESRALVDALPAEITTYLEPEALAHFDFLGDCTPRALDILRAEEPDDIFVCIEGREERQADHKMISDAVVSFFGDL